MTSDEEQSPAEGERHAAGLWWQSLGPIGGVLLVVTGIAGAAWVFLRLPGAPDTTPGYYQAARAVTIGLVVVGAGLIARSRARSSEPENAPEGDQEPN